MELLPERLCGCGSGVAHSCTRLALACLCGSSEFLFSTELRALRMKAAYQAAGFPWIEVRSWHVISRVRRQPLPVLDWAGSGLPQPPQQHSLFDAEGGWAFNHRRHPMLDEFTKESVFIMGRPQTLQERETLRQYREPTRLGPRFDPV